jgi:quercetin dioxygenase-like cupin family protein
MIATTPSGRAALVAASAIAGGLAVPLHVVATPLSAAGAGLFAALGLVVWRWSRLQPLALTAGREAVTAVAEFQPGATVGRHTHPGEEIGYILEGIVVLEQEGQQPVALGPGKTFFIPAGTIHNATNKTSTSARVLANYIVEPGKPLATPVATK